MDTETSYNQFKQIDYKTLTNETLKKLHKTMCEHYLIQEQDINSYYFSTGIKDFDLDLEDFDSFASGKLNL